MPDRRTLPDDELENPDEERERGVGDDEEEFDDTEDLDEDEDEDDEEGDLDSPRGAGSDRDLTSEIGSEGGSPGDMEVERRRPRVMRGSEAGTTAITDRDRDFDDGLEGGGVPRPR